MKRKHIWKKAFSLSFAFHLTVIITVGSMVAGFHREIQRPQEQLITVNLADTPEEIEQRQEEKSPFTSFKEMFQSNSIEDNSQNLNEDTTKNQSNEQNEVKKDITAKALNDNSTSKLNDDAKKANNIGEFSSTEGILEGTSGSSSDNLSDYTNGNGSGESGNSLNGDDSGNGSYSNDDIENGANTSGGGATEDRYTVASRFAQAVEANKSYPYAAIRLNQQGIVTVNVTLDAAGNLISANVVSSAGANLDKAALNAVRNACPFSHGLNDSINMDVPVHFYLN